MNQKASPSPKRRPRKSKRRANPGKGQVWRAWPLLAVESTALILVALLAVIAALGLAAAKLHGTGLWASLLPFASVVLALAVSGGCCGWLWIMLHRRLVSINRLLPVSFAVALAATSGYLASRDEFLQEVRHLRILTGGPREAERVSLTHQVFAAYRRSDLPQLQLIMKRAAIFLPVIREAAAQYQVNEEIMVGIAATESSFIPRDSKDGGRGLFQITQPPKSAVDSVKKCLLLQAPDWLNDRHNAYAAAATFRIYLEEMHDDLFLGLLAYNIGPKNGGLLSIMGQYGAHDFISIQPYLQNLPRDYPIRVLTAALAWRLWQGEGRLPRYEEENNALHIQNTGVPGL
ncbi:transglycosylase SLT domain-containing protein [Candidatus Methylospira mobilis]|uniref:Transglycosylase SLT domain-containing protein n=1 Tax=Candidatus Methylospira mobilis TaxID=1808979 RepID=A0A5Q0BD86_9GAMM|nr:transglycosylase SLT domain-containing protein [Candidatus Methylospira mobilis]QFY41489.1 transglycosylase SLT domain-containing protein [Candidatus Methylospira mobilis]WNV05282.1 transglycosylase SLT domain-containing protein [Candidatus Methylospira mobilis]